MVNYTGRMLTWDEALGSRQLLGPRVLYTWDAEPPTLPAPTASYPVAMPGQTKFVSSPPAGGLDLADRVADLPGAVGQGHHLGRRASQC